MGNQSPEVGSECWQIHTRNRNSLRLCPGKVWVDDPNFKGLEETLDSVLGLI